MPVITENIRIVNKLGLHARPAALLVQTTSNFNAEIQLENDGVKVNGKSIMGVMMLAAAFGSEITVIADGDDAEDMIAAVKELIESKFDEE